MKSTCKNPELEIASWVICCNWFSCTNLNALQTVLVSAGRILTWIEEQLSSSVPSAGKAHLGPKSALWLSPVWTRHSLAQAAAIPLGVSPSRSSLSAGVPIPSPFARLPTTSLNRPVHGLKSRDGFEFIECMMSLTRD